MTKKNPRRAPTGRGSTATLQFLGKSHTKQKRRAPTGKGSTATLKFLGLKK